MNERQVENSGIPQGTLIRRHRIPLQAPNDNQFYTVEHFNVGKTLEFYSKSFRLINCDYFTKKFLEHLGVKVGEPEEFPDDPYEKFRIDLLASMQPLRPYEKVGLFQWGIFSILLGQIGHIIRLYSTFLHTRIILSK